MISFPVETAGDDLSQLLNVVLGNISLKPAIRAENLDLPPSLLGRFRGPRFGRTGLRELTGVAQRPLVSTALKPMGLAPADLAELAYRFALGGIDLIKDDHGLTNQTFSRFEERLARCTEAVAKANRQTGMKCLYLPNVTASPAEMIRRARLARQAGAGGLLGLPGNLRPRRHAGRGRRRRHAAADHGPSGLSREFRRAARRGLFARPDLRPDCPPGRGRRHDLPQLRRPFLLLARAMLRDRRRRGSPARARCGRSSPRRPAG